MIEKIPLLILSAASCVVTYFVQHKGGAVTSTEQFPIGVRVANALVAYIAYIFKMIWPEKLAAFYPHPGNTLPAWQVICAAL
ncbi:MAG: hypothetical protein QME62_04460, partial [Armatimonadota bacterium]|nr:hypothetical protein [Armatimonadota bacterium]